MTVLRVTVPDQYFCTKHPDLNITAREKKSRVGTGVPAYGEIFTSDELSPLQLNNFISATLLASGIWNINPVATFCLPANDAKPLRRNGSWQLLIVCGNQETFPNRSCSLKTATLNHQSFTSPLDLQAPHFWSLDLSCHQLLGFGDLEVYLGANEPACHSLPVLACSFEF